jgi:hypothetical protein
MVRTTVIPKKKEVSIEVPAEYIGTEVEVIAFQKNEGMNENVNGKKKASFSAISIDTLGFLKRNNAPKH